METQRIQQGGGGTMLVRSILVVPCIILPTAC